MKYININIYIIVISDRPTSKGGQKPKNMRVGIGTSNAGSLFGTQPHCLLWRPVPGS